MQIGILGPGALGTCFAVQLGRAGHRIVVLDRRGAGWLEQVGLRLEGPSPEKTRCRVADPATPRALDAILVFVKAYQTEAAVERWRGWLEKAGLVASFQNGTRHGDLLRSVDPELVLATTAQAATRLGPGHAFHAGAGHTWLCRNARSARLAALLNGAGIGCEEVDGYERVLWEKLAVSAAINPVSALLDAPNGKVWQHPHAREVALAAARETWQVGRALGVPLADEGPDARVEAVCQATQQNISSMCADLRRGSKTEIDAISLAVVEAAARCETPAPVNWTLAQLILARTTDSPVAGGVAAGTKEP